MASCPDYCDSCLGSAFIRRRLQQPKSSSEQIPGNRIQPIYRVVRMHGGPYGPWGIPLSPEAEEAQDGEDDDDKPDNVDDTVHG